MFSAWSRPRALATQTAVITLIGLGLAAPATAAPGDAPSDRGSDTAAAAKAEASAKKSTTSGSTKGSTRSEARVSGSAKTTSSDGPDHSQGNAGTSGTWSDRQPNSGADDNTGGANGQCMSYEGVYCSTRDGSASANGNNVGESTGRPCAGCVGKADNKNPQGQKPDAARDGNNGYECDGNNGIAKGNPAHTSCVPPTQSGGGGGGGGTVGGVDTVVPPVVKGVETLVPPEGVELTVRPQGEAPQVLPGAAVLPATGATTAMTSLSALASGLLALGSAVLVYRRFAVAHG